MTAAMMQSSPVYVAMVYTIVVHLEALSVGVTVIPNVGLLITTGCGG